MSLYLGFLLLLRLHLVASCTNIIITKETSSDSSNIIAYNADSGNLYGSLYHYPSSTHDLASKRIIYDWDSGVYLGEITEAAVTHNVVGNINEFGLIIGESTFGGLSPLQSQSDAIIDYGSLIWVTLQRCKTARDAIKTLGDLMMTYGYYSEGESFSIADDDEAWIMEIIGKGNYELGAVWVAIRLPQGSITAHANQARIRNFPLNDPENCLYSSDVISFARKIGIYDGIDEEFSFSDIYDPVTFEGARFCEARVWSIFGAIMGSEWMEQYIDYIEGRNLTNRMPLFIYPPKSITLSDVMNIMRSHYETTPLDMAGTLFTDVGSGDGNSPFRAHPLTWSYKQKNYFNERPIATQQTGWNFIAQSRSQLPYPLKGLLWFGVDDSSTTVRLPIYSSVTQVPYSFAGKGAQDGVTPPMMKFDIKKAFYVFNLVANFAYSRWSVIYPDVLNEILHYETYYYDLIRQIDQKTLFLLQHKGEEEVNMNHIIAKLTSFSMIEGELLVHNWGDFFGKLFVRYRDGYEISRNPEQKSCGCDVKSIGYSSAWYGEIVRTTGSHYLEPPMEDFKTTTHMEWKPIKKSELLNKK